MHNSDIINKIQNTLSISVSNPFSLSLICILLLSILLLCILINYFAYTTLLFFVLCGFMLYLILLKTKSKPQIVISNKVLKIFLITYILSQLTSIIYLYFIETLYSIHLLYYILIAISGSSIFIVSLSNKKYTKYIIPVLGIILGINIYVCNIIIFPYGFYSSNDTHYQIFNMVIPIINTGAIPPGFVYTDFPLHNIFVAIIVMVQNINTNIGYCYISGILISISAIFIYLLSYRLFGQPISSASMLLFLIAPEIYWNATHAYQFSYAIPLALLLLTCTISIIKYLKSNIVYVQEKYNSWVICYIIAIISLVWTHHYTSFLTFIIILMIFTIYAIFNNIKTIRIIYLPLLNILIILLNWLYESMMVSKVALIFNVYLASFLNGSNYQSALVSRSSQQYIPIFLDKLGMGIIFLFITIGCLYGIYKKNVYIYIFSFIGIIFSCLMAIGVLLCTPVLLSIRILCFLWFASYVFLAGYGIVKFIEKFGAAGATICCLLMIIVTIICLTSNVSSMESSLFLNDQPFIKLFDKTTDYSIRAWVSSHTDNGSNIRMSESWLPRYMDKNRAYLDLPVNDNNLDINLIGLYDYIIIRDSDYSGIRLRGIPESEQVTSVINGSKTTVDAKKEYMKLIKLDKQNFSVLRNNLNLVYSTNDANMFYR